MDGSSLTWGRFWGEVRGVGGFGAAQCKCGQWLSAKGAQGLRLNNSARYYLIFILRTLRRQVIVVVFLFRSITSRGVINCSEQPKALHRAENQVHQPQLALAI